MSGASKKPLVFYLNGKRVEEAQIRPEMTLLEYLRVNSTLQFTCPAFFLDLLSRVLLIVEGLTGSKLGCGEGMFSRSPLPPHSCVLICLRVQVAVVLAR